MWGESDVTFTEFVEHVQRTIFTLQMSESLRAHKSLQEINLWWLAGWLFAWLISNSDLTQSEHNGRKTEDSVRFDPES